MSTETGRGRKGVHDLPPPLICCGGRPASSCNLVIVCHLMRGSILLMGTELNLSPPEIIEIYGLTFRIKVSFKQASLRVIADFRISLLDGRHDTDRVKKQKTTSRPKPAAMPSVHKLSACHRHIHPDLIDKGLLQILSASVRN